MTTTSEGASALNVADVFDILCRRISECVVENNNPSLKRVKSVIANNFSGNKELNRELALYNEVLYNNFLYESNARAFLEEVLAHSKTINQERLNEQLAKLIEESKPYMGESTPRNALYDALAYVFAHGRKKRCTLEESREYYGHVDSILHYLVTNKTEIESDPVKLLESVKPEPVSDLVLHCAVKRFNTKYESLSPIQREVIQDFVYHRSADRFKKSLLKRLKNISESLVDLQKKTSISNIPELRQKIKDYYGYAQTTEESINNLMINVCDMAQIVEELRKFATDASASDKTK